MPDSNSKGDRRERELVNWLYANGFAVMRAPSSGSATDRDLPDVLAGNGEDFYAFEAKASAGDPIYYSQAEVESLEFFAENFGAKARLGARFDELQGDPSYGEDWPGWYFFAPGDVHRTDGGNYRIKKELAEGLGTRVVNL